MIADNTAASITPRVPRNDTALEIVGSGFDSSFGLYRGLDAEEIARSQEALDLLDARSVESQRYATLSQGERKRTLIARALVNRPRLLLADEPTGNLDTNTSLEIMQIIEQLNREQHITVVLVTHEPEIAAYADRVLTFRDGQIVDDVMQRPASPISVRPSKDAISRQSREEPA